MGSLKKCYCICVMSQRVAIHDGLRECHGLVTQSPARCLCTWLGMGTRHNVQTVTECGEAVLYTVIWRSVFFWVIDYRVLLCSDVWNKVRIFERCFGPFRGQDSKWTGMISLVYFLLVGLRGTTLALIWTRAQRALAQAVLSVWPAGKQNLNYQVHQI